jgi:anti-sigma B factor antagonist
MSIDIHIGSLPSRHSLVRVAGEIDLATAPELSAALDKVIADGRAIVLDLSDVEFIDTTGVRVMLDARRAITDGRRELTVVAPPDSASRRLLELTELLDALSVVDDIEDVPVDGD